MSGVGGEVDLLVDADDGAGDAVQIPRWNHNTLSHLRTLFVWGTFGGATVVFQISFDGTTWFDVADADAITAQTAINVEFRAPYCRCSLSGGTGASVSAKLL